MRKRIAGAAAGAVMVLAATVGCGGSTTTGDGVLTVGLSATAGSLDPYNASAMVVTPYLSLVYERLTAMKGPGREITPLLATEWEFSEDGRATTFTLRADSKFSDGTPVDANAVVQSLNRARDTTLSRNGQQLASIIESVTATAPNTVRVSTSRPASDLPYLLSGMEAAIVNPALLKAGTPLDRTTGGSGPYTISEFLPGDHVEYTQVADYWDTSVERAPKVTVRGIPDDNARLNAFRSGQLDLMLVKQSQYDAFESLSTTPGLNEHIFHAASFYALQLDLADPVMSNVSIRRAINYAINREGIAESLLDDQCDPVSGPIVTDSPEVDGGTTYSYDPDRARRLVAESGVPGPIGIRVVVGSGLSPQQELAVVMQSALSEIGIDLTIENVEVSELQRRYSRGGVALMNLRVASATDGMTMDNQYLQRLYFPAPPSEEFRSLVSDSLDPAMTEDARGKLSDRAAGIASTQAFDGYICTGKTIVGYNDSVTGVENLGQADYRAVIDLRELGSTEAPADQPRVP